MALILWAVVAVAVVWFAATMAGGLTSLISSLVIGAVAGWLAGTYMRGRGFGVLKNILIGIVGAVVGGILLGLLGLHAAGLVGSIVTATVGAIAILSVARWIQTP